MKKTILTTISTAIVILVLTMPASATTIVSLSPASVNVAQGQNFNAVISVNPQGISNYAEKIELKYPADMLQVNSFILGSTWMALTQPGYDLTDNTNGLLLKSAGYPGGFSSTTTFGTVSFYAKKAGSGTITIGNNSLAFEVNSQSALSGSSVSFTTTAPASVPVAPKAPTIPSPAETPATPEQPTTEQPIEQPVTQTAIQNSFAATIGGLMTLGTGSTLIGFLVVILILAIVAYAVYIFIQRKKQNK